MKTYIIFPYSVNGERFIEAYPFHPELRASMFPPDLKLIFGSFESRNQARLCGYKRWYDETGAGFKDTAYRAYARGRKEGLDKTGNR